MEWQATAMKSIIDQQKIARRASLSNIASIGGLFALLVSVLIPLFWPGYMLVANLLLFGGLGISMVGIYFANRWVKKPRPEASLDAALKSLSNAHRLYHYPRLPCDHVLLTPNGLFVLETINLAGYFIYKRGRWREKMNVGRALRYIVEEHLGDPIKSARSSAQYLEERLSQNTGEGSQVPVKALVVFSHPVAVIDITAPPIPVCKLDKLKKHLQMQAPRLDQGVYAQIAEYLDSSI